MSQRFLNYEQQVDKLINEKDLIICNRGYAVDVLKHISYFALIGGYKRIFINPSVG